MSFVNPQIKIVGILFQNSHGSKYYSHYYTQEKSKEQNLSDKMFQNKFELNLLSKVKRMNVIATLRPQQTQIFTYDSYTVLFKIIDQLQIYLIVDDSENFVLMENVINTLGQVLLLITKQPYKGKTVFKYLHDIILAVDQIIHEGYIVCLEPGKAFDRLRMKDGESPTKVEKSIQKTEQPSQQQQKGAFSSLFGYAKNTLGRTLNFG